MPSYNRVHTIRRCKECEKDYSVIREIKHGYIWSLHYVIGEKVALDGRENIPIEQLKNINCPHCHGDSEFDIIIKDGKVRRTPRRVRHYVALQRLQKIKV